MNLAYEKVLNAVDVSWPSLIEVQTNLVTTATLEDAKSILHCLFAALISAATSGTRSFQSYLQNLSWSNAVNIFLLLLVLANFKSFPLVYHLRLLNGVRHMLKSQRSPKPLTPDQLFQPLITSSRSPLMESDVYGHKNNNTYLTDHDIARTHLLCTLFSAGIEKIRGSVTMNGLSGKKRSAFTIPLGAICCSFRRELRPYEQYDMWTRILSWDEKWIYIVTHFVKKGAKIEPEEITLYPQQNSMLATSGTSRQTPIVSLDSLPKPKDKHSPKPADQAIAASAMSKLVFKDGRITIAPEVLLEASGLLPPKTLAKPDAGLIKTQVPTKEIDISFEQAIGEPHKVEGCDSGSDSGYESSPGADATQIRTQLTREAIETERVRGLRLAKMLAGQAELEHEFRSKIALGKHRDGYGVEGVAATLMQLGKLSNNQML